MKKYERHVINHNIRTENKSKLRKLIRDEFNTLWKTQVSSFPKADTYREFKNRVKFESYLSDIKNRKYRVIFTIFRLSDHILYENRNELFMAAETEAPNFINLNTQEQFIFLMSQENRVLNYKIISTIHEWFTKSLEYSENLIL